MQLPPKKHHQRGGRRPGAGRKPKPDARVQLSCRVAQDTLQALRSAGVPIGRAIDAAIDAAMRQEGAEAHNGKAELRAQQNNNNNK